MQFRIRPSSKKSTNNDLSAIDFPSIKSFHEGSSPIPRSISSRMEHFQTALTMFQQLYRKEKDMDSSNSLQIQKRLDRIEYKIFNAQQDLKQLSQKIKEMKPTREVYNNTPEGNTSKNEIMVLKQVMLQERDAHKESLMHQNTLIEQLNLKQMRAEQEFRELIAQQRMDYEYRLNGKGEQLREIEGLKQRKIQHQYELMKGVISNAQRKIYDELQRKIQNEIVIKDYIESKLADLKEEFVNDYKETITTQTKFIKETKQSLENLFALINNVRRELSQELAETQKLSVKSIQKLSNTLDSLRSKSSQEIRQINNSQQEISNELVDIRNFFTTKLEENRQFMSEFESQTMQQLQHSGLNNKSDSSRTSRTSIDGERFSLFQKEMNQWKSITQQKNLNVFKEISNTLKTMKLQWRKENDQLVSEVAALDQSLKNVKKSGPVQLKKNIQAVIAIFNNQFDVLADQLESLTEMIALAKRQNQKSLKEQLSKNHGETILQVKTLIGQRIKQCNTYSDKSITKSEEAMKGFISKEVKYTSEVMNKRFEKIESDINQLESSLKKANLLTISQLEDYSVKLKNFNDSYKEYLEEQRKEDLKKRMELEESMRKNASNLMDICYKKSEFLVEGLKKNIQTSQMKEKLQTTQAIQSSKDQLRKQVQGARLQWQKELSTGMQKLTKQRENSEEILHEAIQQSLTKTKTNLTNDLNSAKIDLEQRINDFKVKELQKSAEKEKDQTDLRSAVQKMIQEEHKLATENLKTVQSQLENQITELEKRNANNKEEIEKSVKAVLQDVNKRLANEENSMLQKEKTKVNENKAKEGEIQKQIQVLSTQIDANVKKIEEINAKFGDFQKNSTEKQIKQQGQGKKVGQQSLNQLRSELQKEIKEMQVRIEQIYSKNENEDQDEAISNLRKSVNKLQAMVFSQQAKNKALYDRLSQDMNKISQNVTMIVNQMRD